MVMKRNVGQDQTRIVVFFRKGGWYPINVREDEDLSKHVELNPGTIRIEDIYGNVLWRAQ